VARVSGGRAIFEEEGGVIYLAVGLRNLGTGIALLHGWYPMPNQALEDLPHVSAEDFRRLTIDPMSPQAAPVTGRPQSETATTHCVLGS
jgi:hypothetical protein